MRGVKNSYSRESQLSYMVHDWMCTALCVVLLYLIVLQPLLEWAWRCLLRHFGPTVGA